MIVENVAHLTAAKGGPTKRSAGTPHPGGRLRGLTVRKMCNAAAPVPAKMKKMDNYPLTTSRQPMAVVRPKNAPLSKECDILTEDFVVAINNYLFDAENVHYIEESFLSKKKVTTNHRSVLVDWMVQIHQNFHLHPETLHLAVYIVDRFVERVDVDTTEFQLVGACAMLLACKYEASEWAPPMTDFVYISDDAFNKKQMVRMEEKMVKKIGCDFGRPHSIHFLESLCKKVAATPSIHSLAKYLSEMCLLDASFSCIKTSLIAASSLWLAYRIKAGSNLNLGETFAAMVDVHFIEEVEKTGKMIARSLMHVRTVGKLKAVAEKYSVSKLHKASCLTEEEVALLEKIIV